MTSCVMPGIVSGQSLSIVDPSLNVRAATELMAQRRIGVVMVAEGDRLVGIFSERDLVTRVVAARRDPDTTTLAEVMTRNPETILPTASPSAALTLMNDLGVRHLPILERDGRIVGMLSVRDLYAALHRQMADDLHERDAYIYGGGYDFVARA